MTELRLDKLVLCDDILAGVGATTDYWGELAQNDFNRLLEKVSLEDDFDQSILEFFSRSDRQDLYCYITDVFGRSSWHELLEGEGGKVAVDLGAGLGAISEFLSGKYDRVYSIEGCPDRCRFLSVRKKRKSLDNVTIINDNFYELPFHDSSVDLVVCNGVLEWVGLGRQGKVEHIQLEFLREIQRILKPDGILYLGIENRFALAYFLGQPDHSDKRFTSLVPRWLASLMLRIGSGKRMFSVNSLSGQYRTYTYSLKGYQKMLKRANFGATAFFSVEPSYDIPAYAYPAGKAGAEFKVFYRLFCSKVIPLFLHKFFASNYFIFGSNSSGNEKIRKKPVFFGYYDRCTLDAGAIARIDKDGRSTTEPVIAGENLLKMYRFRKWTIDNDMIIAAYGNFDLHRGQINTTEELSGIKDKMGKILAPYISRQALTSLIELVAKHHVGKTYHGDFWLGNIILEKMTNILVLIDPEKQVFGSPELDIADFLIDYKINKRVKEGFRLDPKALYCHFDLDRFGNQLIMLALARQVLRYSPLHRSNILVYRYGELLRKCEQSAYSLDICTL